MIYISKFTIAFVLVISSFSGVAQELEGFWNGYAELMGRTYRLEFEFTSTGNGFEGTMRSPDQGAPKTDLASIQFDQSNLKFEVPAIELRFEGTYAAVGNTIEGQIFQNGMVYPINLQREKLEEVRLKRPQTPQPPFDYHIEEVTFPSTDGSIHLAGTLTTPTTDLQAVVVMVSGSGPQNRDSNILDHKSFWVWADYFAQNGIACLRYDDRGVADSEGNFAAATSFDFANDARAALDYLLSRSEFAESQVGLVGHSEGGLIAAIVGAMPERVDFLVSLAGMGKDGRSVLETQNIDLRVGAGLSLESARTETERTMELIDLVVSTKDSTAAAAAIFNTINKKWPEESIQGSREELGAIYNNNINNLWMRTLLVTDPAPYWEKTTCPVLAINGDKDLQVSAGANLRAIQFALRRGGNTQSTFRTFKNHNHLLQETENGSAELYGKIEQTVSPEVLTFVTDWILKTTAEK